MSFTLLPLSLHLRDPSQVLRLGAKEGGERKSVAEETNGDDEGGVQNSGRKLRSERRSKQGPGWTADAEKHRDGGEDHRGKDVYLQYVQALCTLRHLSSFCVWLSVPTEAKLESLQRRRLLFREPPGYLKAGFVKCTIRNTPAPYSDTALQHSHSGPRVGCQKVSPLSPCSSCLGVGARVAPRGLSLPDFDSQRKERKKGVIS